MFVVMVASECAPVAKAGGLADVVFGLSRELEIRGHAVEIVLPKYDTLRTDHVWDLRVVDEVWVPWHGGAVRSSVWFGHVHGRRCYFLEPHADERPFSRGELYGFDDDPDRFALFSKAALEFLLHSGKRPEVIHCHDWQTGLVPVLLYEQYQHGGMAEQRVCYTIHNFRHQGLTGAHVLWTTGLGRIEHFTHHDRLGDHTAPGAVNLMKGGIVYSNFVTTVSPRHAHEAQYTDQGHGLGHTLWVHREKFGGVLNGIDYNVWNPEIDPHIPVRYSAETIERKYDNKRALRDRLLLRDRYRPIIAFVSRLDDQKGVHLADHALFYTLANGGQFVVLGSGHDPAIQGRFAYLRELLRDNPDCHLELGYDEELAHLLYAGADMLLVPSLFEPCGLTPMIAMRYGTVPVVRAVGGMVDTVADWDFSDRPASERTGYAFHETDGPAVESALWRALRLWYDDPRGFRELMLTGMRQDHSWAEAGGHYLNIYEHIRHR